MYLFAESGLLTGAVLAALGLVIGWLGCRVPETWLASSATQKCAGIAAVAIIVLAWTVGSMAAS